MKASPGFSLPLRGGIKGGVDAPESATTRIKKKETGPWLYRKPLPRTRRPRQASSGTMRSCSKISSPMTSA